MQAKQLLLVDAACHFVRTARGVGDAGMADPQSEFSFPYPLSQAVVWWSACIELVYHCVRHNRDEPAMNEFDAPAYNMAAISATVALYRALIKKGVMAREEAMHILLDEAVAQAILAEGQTQEPGVRQTTIDINRESAEILKFLAEKL